MDVESELAQARVLVNQGKKRRARESLREIAKLDPKNEEMWLLFAQVAEKQEHAVYCLEQVIKINPYSLIARTKLAGLRSRPSANPYRGLGIGVLGVLILLSVALLVWVSNRGSPASSSPSEHQLDSNYEAGEKRFGYTESERRQIWEDIIRAEDRADVEALQIYPDMSPYDEWRGLFDELAYMYKSELAQKLGLSYEQLGEIAFEAIEKDWPFPPLP